MVISLISPYSITVVYIFWVSISCIETKELGNVREQVIVSLEYFRVSVTGSDNYRVMQMYVAV